MKYRLTLLSAAVALLSSCLFTEPVFEKGFEKPDASLAGVWMTPGTRKDPRKAEFAVVAPMGDGLMIHHPAGPVAGDGGIYYEARQLTVQGRMLLQLRLVATFKEGPAGASDKNWTLVWVERKGDATMVVRSLKGEEGVNPDPVTVRRALEGGAAGWEARFGEPQQFERLPARGKD
jgi:hypothetical protein